MFPTTPSSSSLSSSSFASPLSLGHVKVGVFCQNLRRGCSTVTQARVSEKQDSSSSSFLDVSDDIMSAFDISDLESRSAPKDLSEVFQTTFLSSKYCQLGFFLCSFYPAQCGVLTALLYFTYMID
jgi:hypothetical protein